jgi:hypothetical protein
MFLLFANKSLNLSFHSVQTFKKKGGKMRKFSILFTSAIFLGAVCTISAQAQDVMKTAKVNNMKVELHVLARSK